MMVATCAICTVNIFGIVTAEFACLLLRFVLAAAVQLKTDSN
jgi:hypothetical protein